LKNMFTNIDKFSLTDNSFWTAELDALLWEREND